MTARRLVVHIGDFKTGSSSIQYALAQGLVSAEGADWHYASRRTHNYLALPLIDGHRKTKSIAAAFDRLRADMAGATAPVELISAEMLSLVAPGQAVKVFAEHLPELAEDMRVVAYVRPHGSAVLARYATQVKLGHCLTPLPAFYRQLRKRRHLFYASRFGAWAHAYGDRFTLRPMDRDTLVQGDVVADFMAQALGTEAVRVAPFEVQNPSPPLEILMALQVLHAALAEAPGYGKHRIALGRRLSEVLAGAPGLPKTKPWTDETLARKVIKHFTEDASQTDMAFFEGAPMSRGMERMAESASPEPMPTTPKAHLTRAQIRSLEHWAEAHRADFAPDMPKRKLRKLADSAESVIRGFF